MKNTIRFPQVIYNTSLKEIHGCAFSAREIEIIAAILLDKPTQQIPDILPIVDESTQDSILFGYKLSDRTVASHIDNIYEKLSPLLEEHKNELRNKITKRDKINYVIQKSNVRKEFEEYLIALQVENEFLKQIEKIFQKQLRIKNQKTIGNCVVIFREKKLVSKTILYTYLARHLNDRKSKDEAKVITTILREDNLAKEKKIQVNYLLYIVPGDSRAHLSVKENKIDKIINDLAEEVSNGSYQLLFLLDSWKDKKHIPDVIKKIGYVHIGGQENYYESVLNILEEMFPNLSIGEERKSFRKDCTALKQPQQSYLTRKAKTVLGMLCLSIFSIGIYYTFDLYYLNNNTQLQYSIHSELSIPADYALLKRPKILHDIKNNLKGNQDIQTIALVGIGGAGKTTLARQYARQQKSPIIWEINAQSTASLIHSLEKLAFSLAKTEQDKKIVKDLQEIKDSNARENKLLLFVKSKLTSYKDWLLIYDNVEKFSDIQPYFPSNPAVWGRGKIIITTKDNNSKNHNLINKVLPIGELDQVEKLSLFISIMTNGDISQFNQDQKDQALKFLNNLPPFPLDVSIAANYIKSTGISYENYLKRLESYSQDFEAIQKDMLKEAGEYSKTRYSIITSSISQLISEHNDFLGLLLFVCLLDSQNIPRNLLDSYKKDIIVDNFVRHLKKYSIVDSTSGTHPNLFLSIHRSIQVLSLIYLTKTLNLENNDQYVSPIAKVLEEYVAKSIVKENFSDMNLLVHHCKAFLDHYNLLTWKIKGALGEELGVIYYYLSYYPKAKNLLEQSLTTLKEYDRENYVRIAQAIVYLGIVARELGHYEEARSLLEQSLEIYKKHLPENHAEISMNLTYLANAYRSLGNYEKARNILENNLALYRKHLTDDDVGIARNLTYLGTVYRELGDYQHAKGFLEEGLQIYIKLYSENHFRVAWTSVHLGTIYRSLGRYEEARYLLERSIQYYRKHFPKDHIEVGWGLAYLGNVYKDLGEYEKAKQVLEESLVIYKKNFTPDHFEVARTAIHLASVYSELKDYEKAKLLLEHGLRVYKKKFHETHVKVAWVLGSLGNLYMGLGNYDEAINLLECNLTVYEKEYGTNNIETARVLVDLSKAYFLINNTKKVKDYLTKAIGIYLHSNHPESYLAFEALADSFIKESKSFLAKNSSQRQNLHNVAVGYLKQALKVAQLHFPVNSPHIKRIQAKLAL